MNGKRDAEMLMRELLSFAKQMLDEHGEFHPFGGYMKPSGEIVHVGVDDDGTSTKKDRAVGFFFQRACASQ